MAGNAADPTSPTPDRPPPAWRQATRPLLGTLVTVGVAPAVSPGADGLPGADALLDAAFAAIERVHALMSFHAPHSDLSRLNAAPPQTVVDVDPATCAVLQLAAEVSRASAGIFDITVAPALVAAGVLPRPAGLPPDPLARWDDLILEPPARVRIARRLWADLGGIAKGYAVDLAAAALEACGATAYRINAGGDLRVGGPQTESVLLDLPRHSAAAQPLIELRAGSLASSASTTARTTHLDGRDRHAPPTDRFVSVVAARCAVADALTKVVLAQGSAAAPTLATFGATAYLHEPATGWQVIGGAARDYHAMAVACAAVSGQEHLGKGR